MSYERSTASIYGSAISLALSVQHHIVCEDRYGLDHSLEAHAQCVASADHVVASLLALLGPLDNGGDQILREAADRAAGNLKPSDGVAGGF